MATTNSRRPRLLRSSERGLRGILIIVLLTLGATVLAFAQLPGSYKGRPFRDKYHKDGAQTIPGRVELALYDLGGEGVAYHDTTPRNDGAALNHTIQHWRPGVPAYIAFFS